MLACVIKFCSAVAIGHLQCVNYNRKSRSGAFMLTISAQLTFGKMENEKSYYRS
jgi:hypothetical protein